MKRRKTDKDGHMTFVEKLYRNKQESYENSGGFLDDDDEAEERRERISEALQRRAEEAAKLTSSKIPDDCMTCHKALGDSFLWEKFSCPVCDSCRDDNGVHKLIARTEAKQTYMLKDCDLDLRKPILRYISKKNPHNPRYGDMKLYLKAQIESRCLEIFESWENFENTKEARIAQKDIRLVKRFEKKIKDMRRHVRGIGNIKIDLKKPHQHVFSSTVYDAEKNEHSQTCEICGYVNTYETL